MPTDSHQVEWEYGIVMFLCSEGNIDSSEKNLNMHGAHGWELVAVTEGERFHTAFLKRRR